MFPVVFVAGAAHRRVSFHRAAAMHPSGDFDYIIMTNANEEALFWELLSEYRQEYATLSESEAFDGLVKRLSELVAERKVGIYRTESGRTYVSPDEYQDLAIDEALAVIKERKNWLLPETTIASMYHLWARDEDYFGEYYRNHRTK